MSVQTGEAVPSGPASRRLGDRARFRFDTHRFPWREAAIVGWSRFDPGETTRLVRRVIEGNAYFSHGLVAAVQVMIIRSLRTRSQRMPE